MPANFLLDPKAILTAADGSIATKSDILGLLSTCFAEVYELDPAAVLAGLEEREKLGSTGFGRGIAMPHARYAGLKRPVAALIRLPEPIDFAAADAMKVELVFALLSPTDAGATHLHALAAMSRMLRDDALLERLLAAETSDTLRGVMTDAGERDAA